MSDGAVRKTILSRLEAIEQERGVRILFAVESGSRAWGFASPDSDYDVRFVYVHPREWYLRVEPQRDVIEEPIDGDLDINGWDLRKALRLMLKANPVLIEWLDSPIAYREVPQARAEFKALATTYFLPAACWHHYHSIAKNNYRGYLQDETVRLKKYFYVLRPLLAARWIDAGRGPAPMRFQELVGASALEPTVRAAIDELLVRKSMTAELGNAPRVAVLNEFIERELVRHEEARARLPRQERPGSEAADEFFRKWLA